jgi:hypothetical protein
MHRVFHLVRRFFGSLRPGGPPAAEIEWIGRQLLPTEVVLWFRLPGPDRRHSAAVARRVEVALGDRATRPVLAAALLHDVGKLESGLRTGGRVVATVVGATRVRTSGEAREWSQRVGYRRRIGVYLLHPEVGGRLLIEAGSDPLTVAWTLEHHHPADRCSFDPVVANALRDADDD